MSSSSKMPFERSNYLIFLSSLGLVVFGFVLMSFETAEYGQGALALVVAPIFIMLGFGLGIVAIFYSPPSSSSSAKESSAGSKSLEKEEDSK